MEGRKGRKRRWIDIELLTPTEEERFDEDERYAEEVSRKRGIFVALASVNNAQIRSPH
jgi:hypothetical protein